MTEHRFTYENVNIDFRLTQENRKTIAATVFPNGAILVKTPLAADEKRLHDFLRRKYRWILKQKRYFAQFAKETEKRYVSGETFRYRGRSYKLLLRNCEGGQERVALQHGTLTVWTNRHNDSGRARRLLETWYQEKARHVFSERLKNCCRLFGYNEEMPRLGIRKQNKRWGSYIRRSNKIILNPELIKAATRHIDYVIMHELCHTVHAKHDKAFYDLLASRLPNWETLKIELELNLLG